MANIDRIVSVQIALNTAGISKEGFSTLLVVGASTLSLARVSTYRSAVEMTDDGYAETDPLYLAAVDFFSQIPHPTVLKIGRRQVDSVDITVKNVLQENGVYSVTVASADGSNTYSYTVQNGDAAADILQGLETAMAGDTVVTAAYANDALTLTNNVAGTAFTVKADKNLTITNAAPSETIAETMAACMAYDSDFYGVALTSRADADILAMAAWAEANGKFTCTPDIMKAADGADVLYTDVWASMGQEGEAAKRRVAFEGYQINSKVYGAANEGAMVLHCLPAHKGEEITADVFEAHANEIFDEAENRLHAQKAVMVLLMK